ncbi:hypothetical protein [Arthrobacter sp. ISL-28]|uniref:hypothetical protein n=1 Tax=Arthrobacter sp. ISL-28 TaxID=2819108 RepID=UPI00288B279C|nr:hypothetical protein [Arthrobacter sp. ISL-28]
MTSLSTVPPDLNDGTGSGFGRFTGNAVLSVNAASECGFGVTFPLTATAPVRGTAQRPLYIELTNSEKNILPGTVTRNFGKFLVTVPAKLWGGSPPPKFRYRRNFGKPSKRSSPDVRLSETKARSVSQ